jgi:hypothetical protein
MYRFLALVFLIQTSVFVFAQNKSEEAYYLSNDKLDKTINNFLTTYVNIPKDFYRLIIQNRDYIADTSINFSNKIVYQTRLTHFLERKFDKDLLYKGRYSAILKYNLYLIKWSEENTLKENILQYPALGIRSLSLFASDSAAFYFLDSMVSILPDEVLRQSSLFEDMWYSPLIWKKLVSEAPLYTKRYFVGDTKISDYLYDSQDYMTQTLKNVYNSHGLKTKAYLLLYDISNTNLTISEADSITSNSRHFLDYYIDYISKGYNIGRFSLHKEAEYISSSMTRSLSLKSSDVTYDYLEVSQYSKEKLITILAFGHQDLLSIDFNYLFSVLTAKSTKPISSNFLINLPQDKFSSFVKSCQTKNVLGELLQLASKEDRQYILSLLSFNKVELDISPDSRGIKVTFIKQRETSLSFSKSEHKNEEIANPILKEEKPTILEENVTNSSNTVDIANEILKLESTLLEPEPVKVVQQVSFDLSSNEKDLMRLKQNPYVAVSRISEFVNEPYAKEFLEYASIVEPDELLKNVDKFKSKFFATSIIEQASLNAPVSAKKYLFNPDHLVSKYLKSSTNPTIKEMLVLNEQSSFRTKPYLLIDDIANGKISIKQAVELSTSTNLLFKELCKIASRKSYLGKYSIDKEMSYYALRFIRDVNDKISQPDAIRFATFDNISFEELYMITVYGREEVFSSTFNGIFTRFEKHIQSQNSLFVDSLIELPNFNIFLALSANNNKISKLFTYFSTSQKRRVIENFVKGLDDKDGSFKNAVMVSETVANITDSEIMKLLQENIKKEYQRCEQLSQPTCMVVFGLLAGLVKDKAIIEREWFLEMSQKYPAAELTTLKKKVVMPNEILVERMYFFDDEDGRDSYISFLNLFKSKQGWRVEDNYNYARVYTVEGEPIEIFANKPMFEESGEASINKVFFDRQIYPTVAIHRGHSFHTERTLERISSNTKLLFIGSCGGFYKASIGLKNAPETHIIATKQIGTKGINDPIIFSFNEQLRLGKDLQWPQFWAQMRTQLGSYSLFYDYVPPHKNIESLFQNAYYKTLGL